MIEIDSIDYNLSKQMSTVIFDTEQGYYRLSVKRGALHEHRPSIRPLLTYPVQDQHDMTMVVFVVHGIIFGVEQLEVP